MKIKFLVIVLVLGSSLVQAQDKPKMFSFGIRVGANLSQFKGNDLSLGSNAQPWKITDNSNRVYGAVGGIFMRIGRRFFVQPEIILSQKGGQFSLIDNKVEGNRSFKMTNIDFPVMFGVKIARVLRINAGPVVAFNVGNSGNLGDAFKDYSNERNFEDAFRRAAVGYQAGIGLDFGKLNFDIRYEGNLTEVFNLKLDNPAAQAQFDRKLNLLQATIGVAF